LFSRTSRRVELTVEGRLFLGNARRMVTESSWASQAAREIRDNDLRIGAPLYTMLIPKRRELIDRLFVEHPNIHLRIFDKSHSRNFADLTRREIDLALHVEPFDVSTAEIDAVSEADWPDGLERLHLDEKQIALQIPVEHPWSRMDAVPVEMLKDQKIAVINRALGAPLSVALSRPLREAGAELVRPPEGHPIAVERYGRLTRIPAVSLGWFDAPADAQPKDVVIRQIKGLDLSTTLSLIRSHGEQRPSAALVWEMAKMPPTKRKPEHRRRSSQADAGPREKNVSK
jgi:DNA-binding transcriptional LysR family regulator